MRTIPLICLIRVFPGILLQSQITKHILENFVALLFHFEVLLLDPQVLFVLLCHLHKLRLEKLGESDIDWRFGFFDKFS